MSTALSFFDEVTTDSEPDAGSEALFWPQRPVHQQSSGRCRCRSGLPSSAIVLYVCTFLAVAASVAVQPIFAIYFELRGWTSKDDSMFYSLVMFANPLTTLLFTMVFGVWQSWRPSKELFVFDLVFTTLGYLIMALVPNRWAFLAGYVLSRLSTAQGSVRNAFIMQTTTIATRTLALALLPLSSYLGAFVGPFVTFASSFVATREYNGLLLNPQTVTLLVAFGLSLARAPFVFFGFSSNDDDRRVHATIDDNNTDDNDDDLTPLRRLTSYDDDDDDDEKKSRSIAVLSAAEGNWRWVAFFSAFLFLFQVSAGVYCPLLALLLVDSFDFGQNLLSLTTLAIVVVSMLSPLLMAVSGRCCNMHSDRIFLVAGLAGTLLPLLVFAWPTGSLVTVLVGGVLANPPIALVLPAANALLSKKLGPLKTTPFKVGVVQAFSSLGYSAGALLGSVALPMYNTYLFLLWTAPLAVVVVTLPLWWRFLAFRIVHPDISDTDNWKLLPDEDHLL